MAGAAMKHMASNFSEFDKFEGVDFRRWQKKMYFLLSSMSVVYVLTTPMPEDSGDNLTMEQDFLEAKYIAEDASSKKFLVSNFTNYKMPDSRPVMEQYNELLDFKHTLKHKKEELTLVELGSHLRIEESLMEATVHGVQEETRFKTLESLNNGSILHMGNKSTTLVHGRGCVDLRHSDTQVLKQSPVSVRRSVAMTAGQSEEETRALACVSPSVRDPVPIPSESADLSDGERLDVVIPIPPGFDERCFNVESDPLESLLNRDSPIDSTKIDSIFDEFSLSPTSEDLFLNF
ncbi:hypothetical protein Tco_0268075 [Tanacetum coccineum]